MTITAEQIALWRRDTPGCAQRNHLNNAGSALPPRTVTEAAVAYLQHEAGIGGYEAEDEAAGRVAEVYEHVARLLGCAPRNVALVENATVAFSQALSAFDFAPGDVLVTTRSDYTSNQLMYLALARRRGLEVLRAEELPAGGVDSGSVRELVRHPRCRLVALSWVPTNSGLVQRAEEVGEICEEAGVPYLVDACQAVGQMPVDVARLRCDYLGVTARKFLRGPRGIGFLYVSDRALERGDYPLAIDLRGGALANIADTERFELAEGARRFENFEYSYALVLALGEAARYAAEAGRRALRPTGLGAGGPGPGAAGRRSRGAGGRPGRAAVRHRHRRARRVDGPGRRLAAAGPGDQRQRGRRGLSAPSQCPGNGSAHGGPPVPSLLQYGRRGRCRRGGGRRARGGEVISGTR